MCIQEKLKLKTFVKNPCKISLQKLCNLVAFVIGHARFTTVPLKALSDQV